MPIQSSREWGRRGSDYNQNMWALPVTGLALGTEEEGMSVRGTECRTERTENTQTRLRNADSCSMTSLLSPQTRKWGRSLVVESTLSEFTGAELVGSKTNVRSSQLAHLLTLLLVMVFQASTSSAETVTTLSLWGSFSWSPTWTHVDLGGQHSMPSCLCPEPCPPPDTPPDCPEENQSRTKSTSRSSEQPSSR